MSAEKEHDSNWREPPDKERSASPTGSQSSTDNSPSSRNQTLAPNDDDLPTSSQASAVEEMRLLNLGPSDAGPPMTNCSIDCRCEAVKREGFNGRTCTQWVRKSDYDALLDRNRILETLIGSKPVKFVTPPRTPGATRSFKRTLANENFVATSDRTDALRRDKKMRRFLHWNGDTILDHENDPPTIKSDFEELIEKIKPDAVLLNELRLKYENYIHADHKNLHCHLANELLNFTPQYILKNIIPSYKHTNKPINKWIRGSAIFVRKDLEEEFERIKVNISETRVWDYDGYFGKDHDFELIAVRDRIFDVPVFCCYVERDSIQHRYHKKAAKAIATIKGIGAGDLNMIPEKFDEIFIEEHDIYDSLKREWLTHQRPGSEPKKVDYVMKDKRLDRIKLTVHKPLLPDKGVGETHYPIVFDVYKLEQSSENTVFYCGKDDCDFACEKRKEGPELVAKGDPNTPEKR